MGILPIISRSVSERKTIGFPLSTSTLRCPQTWLAGKSKKPPNSMEVFIAAKILTLIPHLFFVYPRLGLHISSRLASAVAAAANAASSLELSVGDFRDFPSHVWGHRRRVDEDVEKKHEKPMVPHWKLIYKLWVFHFLVYGMVNRDW